MRNKPNTEATEDEHFSTDGGLDREGWSEWDEG